MAERPNGEVLDVCHVDDVKTEILDNHHTPDNDDHLLGLLDQLAHSLKTEEPWPADGMDDTPSEAVGLIHCGECSLEIPKKDVFHHWQQNHHLQEHLAPSSVTRAKAQRPKSDTKTNKCRRPPSLGPGPSGRRSAEQAHPAPPKHPAKKRKLTGLDSPTKQNEQKGQRMSSMGKVTRTTLLSAAGRAGVLPATHPQRVQSPDKKKVEKEAITSAVEMEDIEELREEVSVMTKKADIILTHLVNLKKNLGMKSNPKTRNVFIKKSKETLWQRIFRAIQDRKKIRGDRINWDADFVNVSEEMEKNCFIPQFKRKDGELVLGYAVAGFFPSRESELEGQMDVEPYNNCNFLGALDDAVRGYTFPWAPQKGINLLWPLMQRMYKEQKGFWKFKYSKISSSLESPEEILGEVVNPETRQCLNILCGELDLKNYVDEKELSEVFHFWLRRTEGNKSSRYRFLLLKKIKEERKQLKDKEEEDSEDRQGEEEVLENSEQGERNKTEQTTVLMEACALEENQPEWMECPSIQAKQHFELGWDDLEESRLTEAEELDDSSKNEAFESPNDNAEQEVVQEQEEEGERNSTQPEVLQASDAVKEVQLEFEREKLVHGHEKQEANRQGLPTVTVHGAGEQSGSSAHEPTQGIQMEDMKFVGEEQQLKEIREKSDIVWDSEDVKTGILPAMY